MLPVPLAGSNRGERPTSFQNILAAVPDRHRDSLMTVV